MTKGEQHIYDGMVTRDRALVRVMRDHGIVNPVITLEEARRAELALSYACALLVQESSGGHNVFGHDPTSSIPVRWRGTTVTLVKYRYYRARRGHTKMQGVGPLQLTWWEKQDRADRLGGCHVVRWNLRVGFEDLQALMTAYGKFDGTRRYNGSGEAALRYAAEVGAEQDRWHRRFGAVA